MHTTASLMNDLSRMGLTGKETLMVHSSMRAIGEVEGRADAVLDAFQSFFAKGLLVFPTFTDASVNTRHPLFDVKSTHSELGILTDLFWQRPGVLRSRHPIHSLAAIGKGAEKLCTGAEYYSSLYDPASSWGYLFRRGLKILLLGVKLDRCTFIHAIEEWSGVPVNSRRPVIRYVLDKDGKRLKVPVHWHTNAHWRNYPIAQDLLEEAGALVKCRFGDAQCLMVDGVAAFKALNEVLRQRPNYFGKPNRYLFSSAKARRLR